MDGAPSPPTDAAADAAAAAPPRLLRALRHRNYRLFFVGQGISLIGTWLTRLATSWLVYRLTGSALLLGIVAFAGQIPSLLVGPFAGVIVDRHDRHRVLLVTQVLAGLQVSALAFLALSGEITVTHVLVLSVVQGLINAFDMPARQALLVEMVEDRADLPNAIALNSSMVNATRLVGPATAGMLIAAVGEAVCFLIDAISYVAVVAALMAMRLRPRPARPPRRHVLHELHEGFAYAFGFPPIRAVLLLLAVVSLLGISSSVLLPVFATEVLGGDSRTLGFLSAATGVGALAGALHLAARRSVVGLGRLIPLAGTVFGAAQVLFAAARWLPLALPLALLAMLVSGAAMISQFAAGNTVLQTITEDEKRGRVMAFFGMAFFGMTPIGSLAAGAAADRFGAPATVAAAGLGCIAASLVFARQLPALRALVRPIYVRKGIIPEVATGLQGATDTTARTAD